MSSDKKSQKNSMYVKGLEIGVYDAKHLSEYISLTDIAKYQKIEDTRFIIRNWMRNRDTIEYLGVWEILYNPTFKRAEFDTFRNEAGRHSFVISPEKWINSTNAVGIVSKRGRYASGTFAHIDIAMSFAAWISPEFQLYLMKDYRRLKEEESARLSLDWNLNRAISKLNYKIHTDAIEENLIPPDLTEEQKSFIYADEADLLNVALFGKTAKEWQKDNPSRKGNIRDYANIQQLLVLANIESYNAILISQHKEQKVRLSLLREMVVRQLKSLSDGRELRLGPSLAE